MARIMGVTAGYTSKSGSSQISNTDPNMLKDLYRYQILYSSAIRQMKTYLDLYTDGSFNELTNVFTEKKSRTIAETNRDVYYYNGTIDNLIDFKYDPTVFKQYKKTIYSILTGFSLAVKQNKELIGTTTENEKNKKLLASKEDLIQYIQTQLNDTMMMNSFSVSQSYNVNATLKPWYMKYFEIYGPPNDGVFNVEKMANVVELLIRDNIITMEDFIQNN